VIVTGTRESADLGVCLSCPRGKALTSSASRLFPSLDIPAAESSRPEPTSNPEVSTMPEPKTYVLLKDLAAAAGVDLKSAYRIHNGKDKSGRNREKMDVILKDLELSWKNVATATTIPFNSTRLFVLRPDLIISEPAASTPTPAPQPAASTSAQSPAELSFEPEEEDGEGPSQTPADFDSGALEDTESPSRAAAPQPNPAAFDELEKQLEKARASTLKSETLESIIAEMRLRLPGMAIILR
jgi:hypothetical protein